MLQSHVPECSPVLRPWKYWSKREKRRAGFGGAEEEVAGRKEDAEGERGIEEKERV